MKVAAIVLSLALASAGCNHRYVTKREIAAGFVAMALVVGIVTLLASHEQMAPKAF